jgi:hypothetical protein
MDYNQKRVAELTPMFLQLPVDVVCPDKVNLKDYAMAACRIIVGQQLRSNAHCADVVPETDGEGFVDMLDLAVLADNWLVNSDKSLFSIDY